MKVKVLLVDDHAVVRICLRNLFSRQSNLTVTGEAASGKEALRLAAEETPEVVIMDVLLPDMTGLEASRQLIRDCPSIKIIIYSGDCARSRVDEALEAGVCGYVSKTCETELLLQAIASVLEGRLFLSPEVGADALEAYRQGLSKNPDSIKPLMSEREKKLLRMVAEGNRNKEIASELDISCKAVELARSRLMKKLGTTSSAELVRYAVREGIAKP